MEHTKIMLDEKGITVAQPACALARVAKHYALGKKKYPKPEQDYKNGIPCSALLDACYRHLNNYLMGDNSEDHLAAVVFNVQAVMFFEEEKPKWQDIKVRKKYTKSKGSFIYKGVQL